MALSRRIARPLLASIFIAGGIDALRDPEGKVKPAEAVVGPLSEQLSFVPNDPVTLVRVNGAVQVGAGTLLAIGKFRRLASLALIASIIPTTYAGHRFWDEADDEIRAQQQVHFLKNLGLLGGLILAAMDTEGEPSLGWRARRRGRQLEAALAVGRVATSSRTHSTASGAAKLSRRQARQAAKLGRRAQHRAVDVLHHAPEAADAARHLGGAAVGLAAAAGTSGAAVARQLRPAIEAAAVSGADAARPLVASGIAAARPLLASGVDAAKPLVAGGLDAAKPLVASGVDAAGDLLSTLGEHLPSR